MQAYYVTNYEPANASSASSPGRSGYFTPQQSSAEHFTGSIRRQFLARSHVSICHLFSAASMSSAASRKVALLTGGAGFLGFHLTHKLLSEGYFVISVDNFCTGHTNNVKAFESHPNYFFLQHDVSLPIPRDAHELLNQVSVLFITLHPALPIASPFVSRHPPRSAKSTTWLAPPRPPTTSATPSPP